MKSFIRTLMENIRKCPSTLGKSFGSERNFFYHLHPLQVTEKALRPSTTLGMGIISLMLFIILSVSGLLLMIYYVPTTHGAHASVQDIQHAVSFGAFTRALHRWSAHAMVLVVFLHLIRVVATAGYRGRELNWLYGISLGFMTLALAFTGYLLPWDQRSFWATSIASAMLDNLPFLGPAIKTLALGGNEVTQSSLLRFYILHVALLPTGMAVMIALHVWRIRKDGGLAVSSGTKPNIPAQPHLIWRELALALAIISALSLVSTFLDAPLGAQADPHTPSNLEKAPWYFVWIQEMASYSAITGGLCFPGWLITGLVMLPFVELEQAGTGQWFGTRPSRTAVLISLIGSIIALLIFYLLHIKFGEQNHPWLRELLNPAGGMILISIAAFFIAGAATGSIRAAVLASFIVLLVTVIGCTLVGLWRGPDWVFLWPWEEWPLVS